MKLTKLNSLLLSLPILATSGSAFAINDFDMSAYYRAGAASTSNTAEYKKWNHQKVGRLGNEHDLYLGLGLGAEVFLDDQYDVYFQSRLVYKSDGATDWESMNADDTDFMFKEINVAVKGMITALPDSTVWVGKRYNQRHDNHIIDTYFWNVSGSGAGIDYIPLGDGLLSVSAIRSDKSDQDFDLTGELDGSVNDVKTVNVNIFDIRYKGIDLWKNANVEVGFDYGMPNESTDYDGDANVDNGLLSTVLITHKDKAWGMNKTVIQYGTNGFSAALFKDHAGKNYFINTEEDSSAYRVMNFGLINFNETFTLAHSAYYTSSVDDIKANQIEDQTTLSLVVRPSLRWDEHNKTIMELGYFDSTNGLGQDDSGSKITIAQAWSIGKSFWARPELRVFASYLKDSDDKSEFGANKDTNVIVGVQVEGWFK